MAYVSEEQTITRDHAVSCDVPWGQVRVYKRRAWWYFRIIAYQLEVTSSDGVFNAAVPGKLPFVVEESSAQRPRRLLGGLVHGTAEVHQFSVYWRMGIGEYYWDRWFTWFRHLPRQRQEQYMTRFPTTKLEGWEGFWEMRGPELLRSAEANETCPRP